MIRVIGAMLIIACGLLFGCSPLLKGMERKRVLSELMCGLSKMKSELCTAAPSLPQLILRIHDDGWRFADISAEMTEKGAMEFYNAWHGCVDNTHCLTQEERSSLHGLGDALGRYVLEEQVAAIERTVPVLGKGYARTKEQLREVGRLYIGVGLSLSVMLVIVLL